MLLPFISPFKEKEYVLAMHQGEQQQGQPILFYRDTDNEKPAG